MDRRSQESPEKRKSIRKPRNLCGWGLGRRRDCADREVLVALVRSKSEPIDAPLLDYFKGRPGVAHLAKCGEIDVLEVGNVVALKKLED